MLSDWHHLMFLLLIHILSQVDTTLGTQGYTFQEHEHSPVSCTLQHFRLPSHEVERIHSLAYTTAEWSVSCWGLLENTTYSLEWEICFQKKEANMVQLFQVHGGSKSLTLTSTSTHTEIPPLRPGLHRLTVVLAEKGIRVHKSRDGEMVGALWRNAKDIEVSPMTSDQFSSMIHVVNAFADHEIAYLTLSIFGSDVYIETDHVKGQSMEAADTLSQLALVAINERIVNQAQRALMSALSPEVCRATVGKLIFDSIQAALHNTTPLDVDTRRNTAEEDASSQEDTCVPAFRSDNAASVCSCDRLGQAQEGSAADESSSTGDMASAQIPVTFQTDNENLPIGQARLAVVVTGLFKPGITDDYSLVSVKHHIISVGYETVDVFVYVEPREDSSLSREEVEACIRAALPPENIKVILVGRPSAVQGPWESVGDAMEAGRSFEAEQQHALGTSRKPAQRNSTRRLLYRAERANIIQFVQLSDLYDLLLAEELEHGLRYSHVIRMRSDHIWVHAWPPARTLHVRMPPGTLAGPNL